jgi:hypothetical protein
VEEEEKTDQKLTRPAKARLNKGAEVGPSPEYRWCPL